MRINTNVSALKAQEANQQVNKDLSNSLEKLSTGLRINKASDDASGMAIADKLRTQASSLGQSIANANSASALIQIADKAMAEQSNVLDTVKTKLIQAANSTTSDDGRTAILKDVQKLLTQLDMIASQTNYNGINLLQAGTNDTGGASSLSFQVGELAANAITSNGGAAANTEHLGGGTSTLTTGTEDLNVDSTVSKSINSVTNTDSIEFASADNTTTGSTSVTIDGKLTSLSGGAASTITLSTSNTEDIAFLDAMAALDATDGFTGSGGSYTLTGTSSAINFDDHNFSSLTISADDATTGVGNIYVTTSDTLTVTNANTATGMEVSSSADGLIGGDLLSTLKNLSDDSFTATVATDFMEVVDEAITQLNTTRSDFGSTQNQLESAVRNMSTTQTNIKAAESVIRDVDYAQESANFNKQNIISQAGTYAMSQANNVQQNILRLLQ